MTKYLGRADIAYDGKKVGTLHGASLDLGGWERKPVVLGDGTVGHTESPKQSELECDVPISAETPVEDINNLVDATVTFRADTGQTWLIRNAFRADTLKFAAKDGGPMKIKINGNPAEKI